MSRLRDALEGSTEFIFTAEFPTVDGGGMAQVERHAERLSRWFTAVNATDNTSAHAHASNVAVAIALKLHGLEPIMQIVCRDKNRLAIEADMAGANLHGIENISLLTGDDVSAGDEPESRRVFDLDGPQAINVAAILNSGSYLSGRKFEPPANFYIGAVENPFAPPYDYRIERVLKKYAAGARYLQLQIGYHPELLKRFCAGVSSTVPGVHLIPTIALLKGAKSLRFMDEKVPGISVPTEVIDRVEKSKNQSEAAYQLALHQCQQAMSIPGVRGLHITDFRHDDALERLMSDLAQVPNHHRAASK